MNAVLLTGASGFVGRTLLGRLAFDTSIKLAAVCRRPLDSLAGNVAQVLIDGLDREAEWASILDGMNLVIHAAARVHIMDDNASNPMAEFRKVNVDGTLKLARQAARAGVKRFIFISSIKVNGEETLPGHCYTADDIPAPEDPYGISKKEAEEALRALGAETGMEVVIIRPVLVYGPGVKANFLNMMKWLYKGIPLPLGAIENKRSLVSVDNLVDLIVTCMHHPAAANQTFLVSDGEDLSTPQLLTRMGKALGCSARLLPIPASWLKAAAKVAGRPTIAQRLCGSLQVDIEKTRRLLDWSPPVSVDEGLGKTADDFLSRSNI